MPFKIAFAEEFIQPLPPGHRFPMAKYELIPAQLLYEGLVEKNNFFRPEKVSFENASLVHTNKYLQSLIGLMLDAKHVRRIGFPLNRALVEREFLITGATVECASHAIRDGVSFNVAGGTHHAYAERGEGFCLLNDCAVSAAVMLAQGKANRILIIDLDVHQGNGTAAIFKNDERVFTFSMHGAHNYPLHKELSDLDIPLPDKTTGTEYLQILGEHLESLIQRVKPDLAYYVAGVDVLEGDKLGRLSLSIEDCKQRDRIVFQACKKSEIPVVVTMGGGYSPQLTRIIEAHCNTYRVAAGVFG